MANYYGVNSTKAFVNIPSDKVDVTDWGGKVRVSYDTYTTLGVVAANEKIYIGKLPKGAKVCAGRFVSADLGTTGVISIGYEPINSADGSAVVAAFFSAVDVNTAAVDSAMAGTVAGYMFEIPFDAYVVAKATTATTAAGALSVMLQYTVE